MGAAEREQQAATARGRELPKESARLLVQQIEEMREDESGAHFKIRVVDPDTANLINRAKAAHELMLHDQDETARHNEAIRPFVDEAAVRAALAFNPDYRADPMNPDSVVSREDQQGEATTGTTTPEQDTDHA